MPSERKNWSFKEKSSMTSDISKMLELGQCKDYVRVDWIHLESQKNLEILPLLYSVKCFWGCSPSKQMCELRKRLKKQQIIKPRSRMTDLQISRGKLQEKALDI
jgi:hypothetical protein